MAEPSLPLMDTESVYSAPPAVKQSARFGITSPVARLAQKLSPAESAPFSRSVSPSKMVSESMS